MGESKRIQLLISNFIRKVLKTSEVYKIPSSIKNGYLFCRVVEKLSESKISKYIEAPGSAKEIRFNFSAVNVVLERDGFPDNNYKEDLLVNGDAYALQKFFLDIIIFYFLEKSVDNNNLERWIHHLTGEKIKYRNLNSYTKGKILRLYSKFLYLVLKSESKASEKDSSSLNSLLGLADVFALEQMKSSQALQSVLAKEVKILNQKYRFPSFLTRSDLDAVDLPDSDFLSPSEEGQSFSDEEPDSSEEELYDMSESEPSNTSQENKDTEASFRKKELEVQTKILNFFAASLSSRKKEEPSPESDKKDTLASLALISWLSFLYLKFRSSKSKKTHKNKHSEEESLETHENTELERLEKQKREIEAQVSIKESQRKLKEMEKEARRKEKEERRRKEEDKKREREKKEKAELEEDTNKSIAQIVALIRKSGEEDEKKLTVFSIEENNWMSLLIDSSLKKGGQLKNVKVVVGGPFSPEQLANMKNNSQVNLLAVLSGEEDASNKKAPAIKVKREMAYKVEDLNNGKYLVIHNFQRTGLYFINIVLFGKELSLSPLFVLVSETGGVWLRPSGNSVQEISSAEMDTGKHVMDAKTLDEHKAGVLKIMGAYGLNALKKASRARKERIMTIVSSEAKDLEERQGKELRRIRRYIENLKNEEKEGKLSSSAKTEIEDAEDALNAMVKKKRDVFMKVFERVMTAGFTFMSIPATKLFSPKPIHVKLTGIETGFLKIIIDSNSHAFNNSTSKVELTDNDMVIKISTEGKNYSLKCANDVVAKYMYKGLKGELG